jgi:hypothetical protein
VSHILAPTFVGFDFDCAPKGKSYSGEQRIRMNSDGSSMRVISWNVHRGAAPETEVELIPPQTYDKWGPEGGENEKAFGNFIDIGVVPSSSCRATAAAASGSSRLPRRPRVQRLRSS